MTMSRDTALEEWARRILAGETMPEEELEALGPVYGWRLLRWEADIPLPEEQRAQLQEYARSSMRMLGVCACREEDEDAFTLLVCCTQYPAKTHRDVALWLCMHALTEKCYLMLEQEGTLLVGQESEDPQTAAACQELTESAEWWTTVNPIPPAQARQHRTRLQTILKRRQYAALAGYVSRALRGEQELSRVCFAFVPLLIEAIWSQHAEVSLEKLTEGLRLQEMTRKPREALLDWLGHLPEALRACPATGNQAPIERVIAGIQADCSLPYSQGNLSRSLGLTPAYFCRLFHEKTGQHFSTFLTRTRMEKAQELLTPPVHGTLQEISQACGYPNKSYFCQVFKKYTGMTPGEFEQQKRENQT